MTDQELWSAYRSVNPAAGEEYEAWAYGDDPDRLAELTRAGVKTATSSAAIWYEIEDEPMPKAGEYSVILNSQDEAVCVTRTTRVYTMPFDQVSAEHARREGEGDLSLAYWRQVHEDFFRAELAEGGLTFAPDMPVVCEEFEVVYPCGSNIWLVIRALEELSGWLDGFSGFQQEVNEIIDRLRRGPLNKWEHRRIKQRLSHESLFHPKCLGDIYVPDFVGDGTTYAWWNYLSGIAKICQDNFIKITFWR